MANVRSARYSVLVFESPVLTAPPVPGRGDAAGPRPGVLTRLLTGQPAGITELTLTQELIVGAAAWAAAARAGGTRPGRGSPRGSADDELLGEGQLRDAGRLTGQQPGQHPRARSRGVAAPGHGRRSQDRRFEHQYRISGGSDIRHGGSPGGQSSTGDRPAPITCWSLVHRCPVEPRPVEPRPVRELSVRIVHGGPHRPVSSRRHPATRTPSSAQPRDPAAAHDAEATPAAHARPTRTSATVARPGPTAEASHATSAPCSTSPAPRVSTTSTAGTSTVAIPSYVSTRIGSGPCDCATTRGPARRTAARGSPAPGTAKSADRTATSTSGSKASKPGFHEPPSSTTGMPRSRAACAQARARSR